MKNKPQVRKIYSFVVDGECEITYTKLEKELKKYLSDYHKTEKYFKNARQDIYQRLKPLLQQAIKRAKAIGEFNFDNTQQGISEMFNIYDEFGITEKDKK